MRPPPPEPHSRWWLKESLDRLAVSYDAASAAIDAFTRSFDPLCPKPPLRARLRAAVRRWAAPRGWPRTIWFVATAVLAAAFMAWISLRILRQFVPRPPPAVLAMVPGVLLTSALAGTAELTASSLTLSQRPSRDLPRGQLPVTWPGMLFVVSLIGCVAWVTIWLRWETGMTAWLAIPMATLPVGLTAVAFLAASLPAPARADAPLPDMRRPVPPTRRLLARQRSAQDQLRGHAHQWSSVAHQCGLAVGGSAAETALARLLVQGELADLPLEGMESFHTQILTTLFRYRPDPLSVRLSAASQRLLPQAGDRGPQESAAREWTPHATVRDPDPA